MKMFPRDNTIGGYPKREPEPCPIMNRLRAIAEARSKTWRDEIEVIDHVPSLKPQNIIRDYWARNVVNLRMCGERGRSQGMAATAVTHAVAEHDIKLSRVIRKKGDYLCGFKTTARRGFDSVTSLDPVNCPQCAKAVAALGLNPSIRIKDGFWS
jgi:hypothetical protein